MGNFESDITYIDIWFSHKCDQPNRWQIDWLTDTQKVEIFNFEKTNSVKCIVNKEKFWKPQLLFELERKKEVEMWSKNYRQFDTQKLEIFYLDLQLIVTSLEQFVYSHSLFEFF